MRANEGSINWQDLKIAGMLTNDHSSYIKLCKTRARYLSALDIKRRKKIKVAILGSASTDFFSEPLEFALDSLGIESEILNTAFNTYAYQMLDPDSPVGNFQPDVVLLVNTPFNQPEWPDITLSSEEIEEMLKRTTEYWVGLCNSLHVNSGCEIVFDNFFQFPWKPGGNLAPKLYYDVNNYLARLNFSIAQAAPDFVHINDVAWMAAHHGVSRWFDLKYWHHAKLPVSVNYIVPYIKNVSTIISSLYGGGKKVLVLDLDNTLWGGVIGDDGLDGIKIGQGTPVGEAFLSFQKYIRQLKDRGVLLAVCSKNDEAIAKLPFEKHPEMHLKIDDFVCFAANWQPKTNNLIDIANKLNLGLDSFVFIDDNPAERELMRSQLPDVVTIELNDEPANYPALIDEQSPFEVTSLSNEDLARTKQYKDNFQRETLKITVSSYNDYLESLEQQATIMPFEASKLDRITQLINKTNQFNLTTQRKTRTEVESIMQEGKCFSACIQLSDKFGDNGIIAVIFGTWTSDSLAIDGWLMSCRVLKRGVEQLTCNYLVEQARKNNKTAIIGRYIPTDRNSMVKTLYSDLGFDVQEIFDSGETKWSLDVQLYKQAEHMITIKE